LVTMSEHVLDDYGMPLPREEMRFNVGLVSEWYSQGETNAFHVLLKPGDLIEFQREGYCHWAVYIGEYALLGQGDDEVQLVRCVVHRANPTDRESLQNMFSTSRSVAKGVHGIGLVVKEPLGDVWGRSKARVNNGLDNSLTPFPSQKVVERVLAVAHGETVESYSAYNILSNNCEHFASWARCGWSISCQVAHRTSQVMKLAMVAGAAFLPRPVSVLGGLCLAGLHMVGDMRRSVVQGAENVIHDITDDLDDIADNHYRTSRTRQLTN